MEISSFEFCLDEARNKNLEIIQTSTQKEWWCPRLPPSSHLQSAVVGRCATAIPPQPRGTPVPVREVKVHFGHQMQELGEEFLSGESSGGTLLERSQVRKLGEERVGRLSFELIHPTRFHKG